MEQTVRLERTKWISRIIAVFSVFYALWLLLALVVTTWNWEPRSLPLPFSTTRYLVLDICVGASLVCFLSWAGFRLWRRPSCKDIWLWALIPSIVVYRIFNALFVISWHVLVPLDLMICMLIRSFLALLVAGLVYWKLTRIFSSAMKIKESVNPVILKWGGRLYFLFLSFTFWRMISGTYWHFVTLNAPDLKDIRWPLISVIGTIVPLALAIIFFIICRRLFITKPLEALEQSPEDLNNGSPGCSETEPGVREDQQFHQHY